MGGQEHTPHESGPEDKETIIKWTRREEQAAGPGRRNMEGTEKAAQYKRGGKRLARQAEGTPY